jgi:L-threonylcarbamoyladenylate synthase
MGTSPVRLEVRANELTGSGALRTEHVQAIVNILVDRGGLALIPSDTCYSLAARPIGPAVSKRINMILGREKMPISLAFDSATRVGHWVQLTNIAERLLDRLTPGPLTVVCPILEGYVPHVAAIVDDVLTVPDRTIGVRIPDSRIEMQLVTACDFPLTTVAVRDHTQQAVTDFEQAREVVEQGIAALGDRVALAMVETKTKFFSAHSTVVRVPGQSYGVDYDVIRVGALTTEDLDKEIQNLSRVGGRR